MSEEPADILHRQIQESMGEEMGLLVTWALVVEVARTDGARGFATLCPVDASTTSMIGLHTHAADKYRMELMTSDE